MSFWFGTTIFSYTYTGSIDGQAIVPTFNSEYDEHYELSATDNGDGTISVDVVATSMGCDIGYEYGSPYYDALYLPSKISFQGLNTVTNIKFYSAMESGFNENGLAYTVGGLTDMSNMFNDCSSLTSIEGLQYVDTSNVTDMCDMFWECRSLESLDLSNWDTSSATNMRGMFDSCESLRSINIRNWDTSNVTDMSWLFEQCYSLKTIIGLDTWDVSNVTDMNGIFAEVWELTTLNISNWSLNSELHTADFMFYHNFELDTIIMNNSDSDSVNRIISELPTRPSDSTGVLNIAGIDDMSQVDAITAESKYWSIYDNLVATYIFNSSTDTLPTFNSEFTYVYTDIDNGDGTITRTITSDSSPSSISFSDKTGLVGVSY
jgi:surface protein